MSLTVFLCSTFADLTDERQKVLEAVRRLQLGHDAMEFFGARPDLPIETCLAEVRRAHILVVLLGHRYGSVVPELGISYSEAEYREGRRLNKPCLVYMRDENTPVLPRNFEQDPDKVRRLSAWKEELNARLTTASFTDPNSLALQVAADLSRTIQELREAERARAEVRAFDDPAHPEWTDLLSDALHAGLEYRHVVSTVRRTISEMLSASGRRRQTVYYSFSSADEPLVEGIARELQTLGFDPRFAGTELRHGDSLLNAIQRGLDSSDFVAIFVSSDSMNDPTVRSEIGEAIARQVSGTREAPVIPILLDDTEPPPLLRDSVCIDMRSGSIKEKTARLVESLQRLRSRRNDV